MAAMAVCSWTHSSLAHVVVEKLALTSRGVEKVSPVLGEVGPKKPDIMGI